ncbi:iron-containing alcohol dehydrogenase family protein [[Clostridium] bifermentans ATCC 638]|uniref:Iron-containing alcohol dehydrogenase family protein n=1 Tax=Paraclostridium bifermentans ATCC 638 = DSM 14991 TaxID=1233171 RepID=T4VST1_PARBF|nr:iron-containing alcohol dehydrogenase [Paraclostridium bifermentans]EQK44538.1 iron-containing alcohol dehydrogenase family protein [[Clostridium] bifermentans ATCC 638] [Paraclostridium bifermentans ATCC 638 = DSM 14991]RIZ57628.1 NADH-dependent alcohol dehydrogenase [Paraclostridium bifermentans]UAG18639.1 iron-containing alcohol dehydrogenase [Paraclostridium bifermentans]
MLNFDYQNRTRIIFGKDEHKNIGKLIKPYANKVLFHFGGQSIKKSGVYEDVINSLLENQIDFVELGGVKPNPRLSLVNEGIELCRKEKIDFILAVGGGSVIDSAKAIAIGVPYNGDVWDFYCKDIEIKEAIPVSTILTIPAAGSESSTGTVITNEEKQLKLSCGCELLRPLLSIINPELYFTLPKNQIANGISDMMSHIMERYFTNTSNTDLIDGLCESTLKTIMRNGSIIINDNKNYDAWAEIALSGNIAHNGLLGLGREQDWASHKIEHELSAIYDVAHGAGLSVVTPAWMKYVYKENMPMFEQFAVNVMGVEKECKSQEEIINEGIEKLKSFYKKLELPTSLKELNINESNLDLMAKKSTNFNDGKEILIGGLKKLNWEDVLAIYNLAL